VGRPRDRLSQDDLDRGQAGRALHPDRHKAPPRARAADRRMNLRAAAATSVAAAGVIAALLPGAALGAVPKASWYWTLAVPASDPNTLLLGTSDGLYRSTDAGKTWQRTAAAHINATSVIQSADTIFLGGIRGRAGGKAVIVVGGAYVGGPGTSVVEASQDGGTTWETRRPRGLPNIGVQALAV